MHDPETAIHHVTGELSRRKNARMKHCGRKHEGEEVSPPTQTTSERSMRKRGKTWKQATSCQLILGSIENLRLYASGGIQPSLVALCIRAWLQPGRKGAASRWL